MPPAARLTDMHTCPMVTGIIPHVGGPIVAPGEPTVLIGFLPAARATDKAVCVGPPDMIAMGSPTVLIGGLMAARIGDPTEHGGVIVLGCFTVMIGEAGSAGGGAGGMGGIVAGLAVAGVDMTQANASVYSKPGVASAAGGNGPEANRPATAAKGGDSVAAAKASTLCRGNSLYQQEEPMSCVLASSRMIIKQMTGNDPGEAALQQDAGKAGWYDPVNGSDPWKIPSLLQSYGVAGATAQKGMSLADIQAATTDGKPVMVGLKNPGHRIVVDGVQNNADGSQTVLVRDPGYPGAGGCREVPANEFLERYNANAPVISFK